MTAKRKRTHLNRSYLRLADLYGQDSTSWSHEDAEFVKEMEGLIDELRRKLPGMCRQGRADALFLEFERCRHESTKLVAKLSIESGSVMFPEWLAESLRAYIANHDFGAPAGTRKPTPSGDSGMKSIHENLAPTNLALDIAPGRGAVLAESLSIRLRDYLLGRWFEGTPGLRGRHSTPDSRITAFFKHYYRYSVVEGLREQGQPLMEARINAPDHVPGEASMGSSHAFERSHKLVVKTFKEDPDVPMMVMLLASVLAANAKAGLR